MLHVGELSRKPLKLVTNRVYRTYSGGKLIEEWQGQEQGEDGNQPEDWVASVVGARNKEYIQDEGLSFVETGDEEEKTVKLKELIEVDSKAFLGESHVNAFGSNMAVLTKILDSAVRLSIQVHPNRDYAKEAFQSSFGKTEAWYILGGREIAGERPYVLLGFKEGITREQWKGYFEKQDISAMIHSLHKFEIQPGDVFLIEGGVPHAIGPGCFLVEIQEPTDYTMRVERTAYDGIMLPDQLCHQGVGFEKMLDCFDYEGVSREEVCRRWYKQPEILQETEGGVKISLLTRKDTDCFSMKKLSVEGTVVETNSTFTAMIVLKGNGQIVYTGGVLEVKQGDRFFVPKGVKALIYINKGEGSLEVLLCCPPAV